MEKILLLNPPGDKLYQRDMYCSAVSKARYYWPSIDLLILSGILSQKYDVDVIDAIIEKINPGECLKKINACDYKAIVFLTGMASWKQDFEFLSQVKKENPATQLIGNGDILLYRAEEFLTKFDFLDGILFDYTSEDILLFLDRKYQDVCAMAFRNNGEIVIRERDRKVQEFFYPVPQHEKFPLKKYLFAAGKRFPFTTVQTSFGCPFQCSFCVASTLGYKYRAVSNVMEELRHVASLGIKEIFFTDFTFEARKTNILELCQSMTAEKLNLSWVCSSRANSLDKELLSKMKQAGCHTIFLGVESGNDDILKKYSKGVSKEQIQRTVRSCKDLGIKVLGHFIIGLPGETLETVKETIAFSKELDCDLASFNIAVPALGTPLRDLALERGWLSEETLEFDASDSFPIMETFQFSRKMAWEWRKRAIKEFYFRPSYLWKMAKASRSSYQRKILVINGLAVFKNIFKRIPQ
ncbi:MAG: radical SAM protein [Candidatus Aminicenantes bacterium]|nr:radical SAM protein [Candidatus Aminicenantes bacterium]